MKSVYQHLFLMKLIIKHSGSGSLDSGNSHTISSRGRVINKYKNKRAHFNSNRIHTNIAVHLKCKHYEFFVMKLKVFFVFKYATN